jgi:D-amino-acid dehydrogenase
MTDVIVIGAGVVGITTALQLRLAGLDVLLLDRDQPAVGASSGNAGGWRSARCCRWPSRACC